MHVYTDTCMNRHVHFEFVFQFLSNVHVHHDAYLYRRYMCHSSRFCYISLHTYITYRRYIIFCSYFVHVFKNMNVLYYILHNFFIGIIIIISYMHFDFMHGTSCMQFITLLFKIPKVHAYCIFYKYAYVCMYVHISTSTT